MEEIPGKETLSILKRRLVESLTARLPGFSEAYPCTTNRRTASTAPLSKFIDHTLLKQQAGIKDYTVLCQEARTWQVHSVCVPSNRVALATELLAGSGVLTCCTVGFPFGYATTGSKVRETTDAIAAGAGEIDMVLPVGLVKDGDWVAVWTDIFAVVEAAGPVLVKVILETSELSLEEKILAGYTACFAGAGFLKTSTGFASGGAQIDDIHLLRHIAGEKIGVKASGGVRTHDFAKACIDAGADRIGASGTAAVLGLAAASGKGY